MVWLWAVCLFVFVKIMLFKQQKSETFVRKTKEGFLLLENPHAGIHCRNPYAICVQCVCEKCNHWVTLINFVIEKWTQFLSLLCQKLFSAIHRLYLHPRCKWLSSNLEKMFIWKILSHSSAIDARREFWYLAGDHPWKELSWFLKLINIIHKIHRNGQFGNLSQVKNWEEDEQNHFSEDVKD